MQVGQNSVRYSMNQEAAVVSFLDRVGYKVVKNIASPMSSYQQLYSDRSPMPAEEIDRFRSVVGSLNYFAADTRYDIALAVSKVSQFLNAPTVGAGLAVDRILSYVAATADFSISSSCIGKTDSVKYYTDSDCGGSMPYTAKSHTGVMIILNGAPVFWRSRKQPVTAIDSGVAEIYAMSEGLKDARYHQFIMRDLGVQVSPCVLLQVDSKTAVSFQKDTCWRSRIKGSFSRREEWVQDLREEGQCEVAKVDSQQQLADVLTKPLAAYKFKCCIRLIVGEGKSDWEAG